MSEKNAEKVDFEKALQDLQQAVRRLESGELSLEDSLKTFENGIRQARECQTYLTEAEKRIEVLTQVSPTGEAKFETRET